MTRQILFLIGCTNDDDESADLFVVADSEASALNHWRKYYGLTGRPDRLIIVPDGAQFPSGGAVPWDSIMQVIYGSPRRENVKARDSIAAKLNATKEA